MRIPQQPLLVAVALTPAIGLGYQAAAGGLGANPVETLALTTGLWALRFLLLSLAVTPIRRVTGWSQVIRFRRTLGLLAFFYATVHVSVYLVLDQGLALTFILADLAKRRFITAGMVAFVLLIPLAFTSTRGWIRRLGGRWQQLHRLVYLSAAAATLHFVWKVKVAVGEPVYYAAVLAILLAFRLFWRLRMQALTRRQPARA